MPTSPGSSRISTGSTTSGSSPATSIRPDGLSSLSPAQTGCRWPARSVSVTADGAAIASLRTTADGTARFLPALYDAGQVAEFSFTTGDTSAKALPGSTVALQVGAPGGVSVATALDVLFLLDATGSMGDEIDRLKATIDSVAAQVGAFESQPDVRFGMTLYRDQGDAFVTSTFDFTGDIAAFRAALNDVDRRRRRRLSGSPRGGPGIGFSTPTWRDPASTVQLVFLVGDAPPHLDRQAPVDYPAAIADAVARGIKVFPIASSESDDQAEAVFREIAAATGARFVFLSYGAQGAATGDATDIASTDYEELPLDALVVRLIAEEAGQTLQAAQRHVGDAVVGALAQHQRGPRLGRGDVLAQVLAVDLAPDDLGGRRSASSCVRSA